MQLSKKCPRTKSRSYVGPVEDEWFEMTNQMAMLSNEFIVFQNDIYEADWFVDAVIAGPISMWWLCLGLIYSSVSSRMLYVRALARRDFENVWFFFVNNLNCLNLVFCGLNDEYPTDIKPNACTMLDRVDEFLQNKRNTKRIKAMMKKKKRRYYARSHLRFLRVARTHSRVRWTFFFVFLRFVPLCSFGLCWIYWLLMNNGYLYLVDELFVGRSTSTMPMYCDSHPRLSNAKMPIFVIAAMNAKNKKKLCR